MTTVVAQPDTSFSPRQRDRRMGFGDVLASLARVLDARGDPLLMRTTFEDSVRRLLPVRSVQLRDGGSKGMGGGASLKTAVALDVPVGDGGSMGVLEATFEPGTRVDDWELQLLGLASHVGALVLELERTRARLQRALLPPRPRRDGAGPLIGSTPAMQLLRTNVERVASTDFTVLLQGESGVGKELVARQVHDLSQRRNGPFVAINCAALVETLLEAELFGIEDRTATGVRGRRGKFECAEGGTLFLDEVSDLSLSAQAKLLRAIQDLAVERVGGHLTHRIDTRIVAATNRALHPLVEQRLFRSDLYYRLSGVDIRVPALRERRADILELALYFLDRHRDTRRLQLSPAAADALTAYDWPGNVRELERTIERAVALAASDVLELDDLTQTIRGEYGTLLGPSLSRGETLRTWASRYVRLVLHRTNGNKREACRFLDISYHTLQSYLQHELVGAGAEVNAPASLEGATKEDGPAGVVEPVTHSTLEV